MEYVAAKREGNQNTAFNSCSSTSPIAWFLLYFVLLSLFLSVLGFFSDLLYGVVFEEQEK